MKNLYVPGLAVAALAFCGRVVADEPAKSELKSGPQCGDSLGAFYVTKVAGAESDGVKEGQNLCYRCRNGRSPQVVVFTRSTDPKVAELVKQLDKAITENESSKLKVFVNVLASDKDKATEEAKKFAATSQAKNVPFVVPNEFENGPDDYGINAKAAVTVTFANELGVKATQAFASASDVKVDAVIGDLSKILN